MVLVQNRYKNTLVGVLRTQTTFVAHSSPLCYVTLRTQLIRLNLGNLGPQKTDSSVVFLLNHFLQWLSLVFMLTFIILSISMHIVCLIKLLTCQYHVNNTPGICQLFATVQIFNYHGTRNMTLVNYSNSEIYK